MIEAEIKIKPYTSLDRVVKCVEDSGYTFLYRSIEEDHYYNHPCRDFRETDEALRLRFLEKIHEHRVDKYCILTYKGPRRVEAGVKSREELEIDIASRKQCMILLQILERLGFREVAVIRKDRRVYRKNGLTLSIDLVHKLGLFIEIEGSKDLIIKEIESIPFKYEIIEKTYLELLLDL